MKNAILSLLLAACAPALFTGCGSSGAQHVDSGSSRTLLGVGKLNMQDWNMAAEKMITSLIDDLINAGKLQSADGPGKPAILAISRIVNNTAQQIDTDLLIKQIRVALNKTGKVVTSTTMGFGGPEDPLAKDAQQEKEIAGNQRTSRRPDYTLSGKIIEDRAREGNVRESTYSFQLSLSTPDGLAVWEDLKNITKQGKRPNAGW